MQRLTLEHSQALEDMCGASRQVGECMRHSRRCVGDSSPVGDGSHYPLFPLHHVRGFSVDPWLLYNRHRRVCARLVVVWMQVVHLEKGRISCVQEKRVTRHPGQVQETTKRQREATARVIRAACCTV